MATIVITGGAGFIGSNVAARHLTGGDTVVVIDSLQRLGSEQNWEWLATVPGSLMRSKIDIRDASALDSVILGADVVYHLAAQVAVTTSVIDPRTDFEVNALGTFNVLDSVRRLAPDAFVIYASTNKVYGGMDEASVRLDGDRYGYVTLPYGVPESYPLDFHSPYGCSKGAGDQYVRDFARIYGIRTVVFRQSCIYGRRQFGNEDQGWVAHFLRRALANEPITIFGDGKQVRDLLWIDDLLDLYTAAISHQQSISGRVFNVGGGADRTASLLDVLALLEQALGRPIARVFGDWRPGDQRVYVSDIRKSGEMLGWEPKVSVQEGLSHLLDWTQESLQSTLSPI